MRHLPLLACLLTVAPITHAQETPPTEPAVTSAPAATVAPQTTPSQEKPGQMKQGGVRSKDMDLRHCLELQDNAAIAKCAGE